MKLWQTSLPLDVCALLDFVIFFSTVYHTQKANERSALYQKTISLTLFILRESSSSVRSCACWFLGFFASSSWVKLVKKSLLSELDKMAKIVWATLQCACVDSTAASWQREWCSAAIAAMAASVAHNQIIYNIMWMYEKL